MSSLPKWPVTLGCWPWPPAAASAAAVSTTQVAYPLTRRWPLIQRTSAATEWRPPPHPVKSKVYHNHRALQLEHLYRLLLLTQLSQLPCRFAQKLAAAVARWPHHPPPPRTQRPLCVVVPNMSTNRRHRCRRTVSAWNGTMWDWSSSVGCVASDPASGVTLLRVLRCVSDRLL